MLCVFVLFFKKSEKEDNLGHGGLFYEVRDEWSILGIGH